MPRWPAVGIEAVCALITRGAGKAVKIKLPKPATRKFPPAKLWYKPKITKTAKLKAGTGSTSAYGDVKVSTNGSPEDQALVLYYEHVGYFPGIVRIGSFDDFAPIRDRTGGFTARLAPGY